MRKVNNKIVIRKAGNFYQVFDNDAIIFWYLFKYRIVNRKVGFPISIESKILKTLEDKKIHYQVIINDNEEINFNKGTNHYSQYLTNATKAREKNCNIDNLVNKIQNLNEEQINRIIEVIEGIIYE